MKKLDEVQKGFVCIILQGKSNLSGSLTLDTPSMRGKGREAEWSRTGLLLNKNPLF